MGIFNWLKNLKKEKIPPVAVNDANFNELIKKSPLPVILDIWGPSCPWCSKLAPTIIELSTKYNNRVRVAQLNASENSATSRRLGVSGVPTILFLRKGRIVERISGFKPQHYLEEAIAVLFPEAVAVDPETK